MSDPVTSIINPFLATAGTRLYYGATGTGGVYTEASTLLGNIQKWDSLPSIKVDELDTTRADQVLSDGSPDWVKQSQPMHIDPSEFGVTIAFKGTDVTTLQALVRTNKSWKILFQGGYYIPLVGWIKEFKPSADAKGEVTISLTIRCVTTGVFTAPSA